jgi:hypothetical protein
VSNKAVYFLRSFSIIVPIGFWTTLCRDFEGGLVGKNVRDILKSEQIRTHLQSCQEIDKKVHKTFCKSENDKQITIKILAQGQK